VFTPYLALTSNLEEKLNKHGLKCLRYEQGITINRFQLFFFFALFFLSLSLSFSSPNLSNVESPIKPFLALFHILLFCSDCNILLVDERESRTEKFIELVTSLTLNKRIARIVFDEIHVYFDSTSYRPFIKESLLSLRSLSVPFLFLSASMTPQNINNLSHILNNQIKIIKANINRPNIEYKCIFSNQQNIYNQLLNILSANEKTIIYVMNFDDFEKIKTILSSKNIVYSTYNGRMSRHEREINHTKFVNKCNIMIATTAYGTGIDIADVKHVVHFRGSYDFVQYVQESGRVGRDGHKAKSTLLLEIGNVPKDFKNIIENKHCIRKQIGHYFEMEIGPCGQNGPEETCFKCKSPTLDKGKRKAEEAQERPTSLVDRAEAGRLDNQRIRSETRTFLENVGKLKGICLICKLLKNIHIKHPSTCPEIKSKCFKCLEPFHFKCSLNHFVNNTCFRCHLPHRIFNIQIHNETNYGNKSCPFDSVPLSLLLLFHLQPNAIRFSCKQNFTSTQSFFNYLFQSNLNSLPQAIVLFNQLLSK